MKECLMDALLDTVKLLPYLLISFVILEFLEHKISKKNEKILSNNKKYGPIVGGVLGAVPQCGFSAMASNLFSSKVITMGTLIAVFLSTSDEMLPIMLSENVDLLLILKIIGFKVLVGITIGIIVDLIFKHKTSKSNSKEISHMCEDENCHCDEEGIFISGLKHTLKIGFFILLANAVINIIISGAGEENIKEILQNGNIFTYFLASLVGLIPNCSSSVIMTELYLSDLLSIGNLMAGLLTGSGIGILLLFRTNKDLKENLKVISIIYFVGVIVGILVDFVI